MSDVEYIGGDVDPALLQRQIEIGFSNAGATTRAGKWGNWRTSIDGLLGRLTQHVKGTKDGPCYLGGSVVAGNRSANSVPHMDLLVLDLDTGENIDTLITKLQKLGWFALIYTTHSHLKPVTDIKKDAVVKWLGGDSAVEPDIDHAKAYLIDVKRYRPEILEDAELLETQHTGDGIKLFVKHKPMPKFRVVLVLKERFVFAKRAIKQADAIVEWKERYAGASKRLGAFFDRSCVDPSRLFYTPRHPDDDSDYRICVVAGDPVDLDTVDRVATSEKGDLSPYERMAFKMRKSEGKNYETPGLGKFFGQFGDRFEVESWLMDVDIEGDRGSRPSGPGRTHLCPNDDAHSDAGNSEDKGFFCVNGTDSDNGATCKCMHDSCAELKTPNFVDLICQKLEYTDIEPLMQYIPLYAGETVPIPRTNGLNEEKKTVAIEPEVIEADEKLENRKWLSAYEARKSAESCDKDDLRKALWIATNCGMSELKAGEIESVKKILVDKAILKAKLFTDTYREGVTLRAKNEAKVSEECEKILKEWNQKYAKVTFGGKLRVLEEPSMKGTAPLFWGREDLAAKVSQKRMSVTDDSGNAKMEPIFKHWFNWEDVRDYDGIVFEPMRETPGRYNLWSGFAINPKKGNWEILRMHILDNICRGNQAYYDWLMTWMAHMVQRPWEKMSSAVVLKGVRGTGKSMLFDFLRMLFGNHALKVSNKDAVVGTFNAHQAALVLLVCEEAFWAGDMQAANALKDKISSNEMMLTPKGVDSMRVENYMSVAFISNEDWVVPASLGDERRFFVLEVGEARRGDSVYFKAMKKQMEQEGGLGAFLYDLQNYIPANSDWDVLRSPPATEWLIQQGVATMHKWESFFYSLLLDNGMTARGNKPDDIEPLSIDDENENLIPREDLKWFFEWAVSKTTAGRNKLNDPLVMDKLAKEWLLAEPEDQQLGELTMIKCPSGKVIKEHITKTKGLKFRTVKRITKL